MLIKSKKPKGTKIDTNLKGKKLKNVHELKFKKKSKSSLFGDKNKLSKDEVVAMRKKLDQDISKIVDYSLKFKNDVSGISSARSSPYKRSASKKVTLDSW